MKFHKAEISGHPGTIILRRTYRLRTGISVKFRTVGTKKFLTGTVEKFDGQTVSIKPAIQSARCNTSWTSNQENL